ncbi:uncharacterized protein BJ171DRAFT_580991 [Polychytrium aggregatum]|uniref:uncharacterized protein n=1 Tax=Polychytrium aggregatum TaxID=110093 RepID=UPI0022FDD32E|nr:uncharacterized protein BJ171DRAFT_580991 [Polychytrium aggregatum]KAI9205306.1 hypothetical protein BJ171DRAFT_580991 [Polychytrium aggregatum]
MLASYYLVKSAVWMFIQPASSSSLGGRLQDLLITGWGRAVAEVPCDGKQPAAKRTNVKNPPSDGLYIVKQVFLIGLQYFIYDAMFYMIKVARSFTKSDPDSYFWRLALGYLCGQFVLFNMVVAGQIMHTVLVLAFGTRNSMFDELFISPNLSSSPRDLWSRRWHRAFRTVWVMVGFKPVHQWLLPRFGDRVGRAGGVLAVFLISGACHAYITSASFHDYDLMSIRFFVLQGIVVIVEELWRETLAYRALTQSLPPWLLELSAIVSMHLFIAVCSQDFIGPYERHLVESGRMPFSLVSGLLEAYPQQQAVI